MGGNELLNAALRYASEGWRVFPVHSIRNDVCTCGDPNCERPAKHPLTSHGLHDATVEEEKISQWWRQWPDANIGVCAEDIGVVMDIDPRNGGDVSLDRLITEYGVLPETVEVITGGGGTHYYFTSPARIPKGGIEGYPGIDIQAAGGYVIAPPSIHRSGRNYEFEASSDFFLGQVIGDCPPWLFKLRGQSAPSRPRGNGPLPDLSHAPAEALHDTIEALTFIDPDIGHDDWVKLGQAIHSQLWIEGFDIFDAFSSRGRKYKGRQRTLRKWNTFNADGNAQGAQVGLATLFYIAKKSGWQSRAQAAMLPPAADAFRSFADFLSEMQPPDEIIDRVLIRGRLYAMTGLSNAGKTAISMAMGACIARGIPFGPHEVSQGRVLFLAGENPEDIRMRCAAYLEQQSLPQSVMDLFDFYPVAFDVAAKGATEVIEKYADRVGDLALIIVDSKAAFFGGDDENSNAQAREQAAAFRRMTMVRNNPAVIVLSHPGKWAKSQEELLPRGGGAFNNEIDTNLTAWADNDCGVVQLHHLKIRGASFDPMEMRIIKWELQAVRTTRGRPMTAALAEPTSSSEAQEHELVSEEDALVVAMYRREGASIRDLAALCGMPRSTVQRVIKRLAKDRFVAKPRTSQSAWTLSKKGKDLAVELIGTGRFK